MLAFGIVVSLAIIQHKKIQESKRAQLALELKIKSLGEQKRRALTQAQIARRSRVQEQESPAKSAPQPTPKENPESPSPIEEQGTASLTEELDKAMSRRGTLTPQEIEDAIRLSEELISREPSYYRAYRAKLILLLTLEGKFNQWISDSEVDSLLDEMANFDFSDTPKKLEEQTFELARFETRMQELDEEMARLENDLAIVDSQLSQTQEIDAREALQIKQNELLNNLELAQERYQEQEASESINEELVEITFARELARKDYDLVIAQANTLLNTFPNSVLGHYYLFEALRLDGREVEALNFLSEAQLSERQFSQLNSRLNNKEKIEDYWKRIPY